MSETRWTVQALEAMDARTFQVTMAAIEAGAWRLLGLPAMRAWQLWRERETGDLVLQYESV